ncbi:hypothetical protein [Nisaea sediminum]|uniref:hypothetical protein n=3 Tax=Pseudomonadota TaxID=1224 RepID=UPI0018662A1C|nr:hypothetical protein [Nisaea sediminum]
MAPKETASACAEDLRPFKNILESGGFYVETGSGEDMHKFAARLIGEGRHVYPGFRYKYEPSNPGHYAAILNHRDELQCCMAWRIFETDNLVSQIETFLPHYCDHNEADPPFVSEIRELHINGRIGYRGGLNSLNPGNRLSWFMTSIAMIELHHAGCDYQCGEARDDMVFSGRIRSMSGYANANPLGSLYIKARGKSEALTLVWSNRQQIAKEITNRHRILTDCDPKDFRTAVLRLKALE